MPIIAISLIVAAALGGGVSIAAQNALPGDALWGFKTSVDENIEGAFAMSDEAKANWDINTASERLNEATQLAAQGKLDASTQATLSTNFNAHVSDAQARIHALEQAGQTDVAADVAARFQAALTEQAATLTQASASDSAVQTNLTPLLSSVRATLDSAAQISSQAEGTAAASTTANINQVPPYPGVVQVQTGASVNGGTGGIQVDSQTGSSIGI